jgi:CRISPR-associated protein Cmr1
MTLPFSTPAPKGARYQTLNLRFKTGTPILGGGVQARELCEEVPIRVPSLRGQFRFWWRANTDDASDAQTLYERETELWGGVRPGTNEDAVIKSQIRIVVRDVMNAEQDSDKIELSNPDAYALWPARATARDEQAAPRWKPGLTFELRITFPIEREAEIRQMLSAWICFGGYGSRTRRGVGKLIPDCPESRALVPAANIKESFRVLLPNLFAPVTQISDWPRLRGAHLAIGTPNPDCLETWYNSLSWLRDFRQGQPPSGNLGTHNPNHARVRGASNRPSISNWPEADKVRRLTQGQWDHLPRHNATPVWPKAALGLPVVSQFQTKARNGGSLREPKNYDLNWEDQQGNLHDRLGSPLFIGAMPIRHSSDNVCQFAPYALWISRSYPDGHAIATRDGSPIPGSAAPFDQLVAKGDQAMFQPLATGQQSSQGTRMRTAFLSWLKQRQPKLTYLPEQGGNV